MDETTVKAPKKKKLKPLKKRMADALLNKGKKKKPKGSKMIVNEDGLTANEEMFCQLYASDRQFFGNGVQSYIEAYDIIVTKMPRGENEKTYEACKVAAHSLLTKPNLLKRIDQIFEGEGLNDTFVDKQLMLVITQNAEFSPKMKGIQEYNKLKKRTSQIVEHKFGNIDPNAEDADLDALIEAGDAFFKKKPMKKKAA